jgi:large-conductance mechanosensitive channel
VVWKYSASFPNQPDTRYWSLGRPRHLKTPDKWERSDYNVLLSVLGKKHLASGVIFLKISWQDVLTHQVHMASKIYFLTQFFVLSINYHQFLSTVINFYQLSSFSINYHQLLSTIINFYQLSWTSIHCHQLLSTVINFYPLSSTFINYHHFLSTIINFCPLSSTSTNYHHFLSTIINFYQLSVEQWIQQRNQWPSTLINWPQN